MNTVVKFKNFQLEATYKGIKKSIWNKDDLNIHIIKIINIETKQDIVFEFLTSLFQQELNNKDILEAFKWLVDSAIDGKSNYEEFCNELCYDIDNDKSKITWKESQEVTEKLEKIFSGDVLELYKEIDNELNQ